MAGKGLTIPLSLDPREWLRGIKVVERSLEDFEDSIEEVEDAGKQLGRKLEDVFDEAGRDARRAGDDIDRGLTDGLSDVEEEANRSAKEFGAAFRGDPVEALEEVQSYLAEIVSVKLPGFAGALATLAGGAALGLIVQQVTQWRDRQNEILESAKALFNQYVENNRILDEQIIKDKQREQFNQLNINQQEELLSLLNQIGLPIEDFNELLQDGGTDMLEIRDAADAVGGSTRGLTPEVLRIIELTKGWGREWAAFNNVVLADTENRVIRIGANIRNLPDLDIGITQQTANALAARANLVAE